MNEVSRDLSQASIYRFMELAVSRATFRSLEAGASSSSRDRQQIVLRGKGSVPMRFKIDLAVTCASAREFRCGMLDASTRKGNEA